MNLRCNTVASWDTFKPSVKKINVRKCSPDPTQLRKNSMIILRTTKQMQMLPSPSLTCHPRMFGCQTCTCMDLLKKLNCPESYLIFTQHKIIAPLSIASALFVELTLNNKKSRQMIYSPGTVRDSTYHKPQWRTLVLSTPSFHNHLPHAKSYPINQPFVLAQLTRAHHPGQKRYHMPCRQ